MTTISSIASVFFYLMYGSVNNILSSPSSFIQNYSLPCGSNYEGNITLSFNRNSVFQTSVINHCYCPLGSYDNGSRCLPCVKNTTNICTNGVVSVTNNNYTCEGHLISTKVTQCPIYTKTIGTCNVTSCDQPINCVNSKNLLVDRSFCGLTSSIQPCCCKFSYFNGTGNSQNGYLNVNTSLIVNNNPNMNLQCSPISFSDFPNIYISQYVNNVKYSCSSSFILTTSPICTTCLDNTQLNTLNQQGLLLLPSQKGCKSVLNDLTCSNATDYLLHFTYQCGFSTQPLNSLTNYVVEFSYSNQDGTITNIY
jgi:hypothetical protein